MRLTPGALVLLLLTAPLVARAQEQEAEPNLFAAALPPEAVAQVALGLAYSQAVDAVPEWGTEQRSFERRARLLFSSELVGASVRSSIERSRHTTGAYVHCDCSGFMRRTRHAMLAEFIEHHANGTVALPIARFAGMYSSVLATAPFVPQGYSAAQAVNRSIANIGGEIGSNMLQEFWPDIRRTVVRQMLLRPLRRLKPAAFSARPQPRP